MTISIIITLCVLLLIAYLFEVSSPKTRIPTVILLLLLGWAVRRATDIFMIDMPNLEPILPVLGTVGLIMIVLEGSLELELNKSKIPTIINSAIIAFLPIILFSFGLAWAFKYFGDIPIKIGLANAIPLSVISSAVAISSATNFATRERDFVTFESSLSDIFGVVLFNFIILNEVIDAVAVGFFFTEIVLMLVIAFLASVGLAYLLGRIKHHIKFAPILIMILLIYSVSKIYHLPGLVFIMIFGIFIANLDEFLDKKYFQILQTEILNREVKKFKELTSEFVFLIRSLFFILFGFFIETTELFNQETMMWSIGIVSGILVLRLVLLLVFAQPILPLLFIAPRGLITILLFLSIPADQMITLVNRSLIIQVIVLTALVMMVGLMFYRNKEAKIEEKPAV